MTENYTKTIEINNKNIVGPLEFFLKKNNTYPETIIDLTEITSSFGSLLMIYGDWLLFNRTTKRNNQVYFFIYL